ncbi:DUF4885 family protein, partial [Bacillus subtilis]|uniref:DUF4885 family protein n=1 Tax=Bacillus subtilis TaxID=1423 RepID=UPI0011A7F386
VEAENEKVYEGGEVNQELEVVLNGKDIDIPEGRELRFRIRPIDYEVGVRGREDEDVMKEIEEVVQCGDNSKELFLYIMKIQSSDS